jgi:prephenate dehydrogenase
LAKDIFLGITGCFQLIKINQSRLRKMMNNGTNVSKVVIVGAGLAGSEAAWYLAQKGFKVILFESKKLKKTPAQKVNTAAELVCTNSLKSLEKDTPHGMLNVEMKILGSLVMEVASECAVPAGGALAVDRDIFSSKIQARLDAHPLITFIGYNWRTPRYANSWLSICDKQEYTPRSAIGLYT